MQETQDTDTPDSPLEGYTYDNTRDVEVPGKAGEYAFTLVGAVVLVSDSGAVGLNTHLILNMDDPDARFEGNPNVFDYLGMIQKGGTVTGSPDDHSGRPNLANALIKHLAQAHGLDITPAILARNPEGGAIDEIAGLEGRARFRRGKDNRDGSDRLKITSFVAAKDAKSNAGSRGGSKREQAEV